MRETIFDAQLPSLSTSSTPEQQRAGCTTAAAACAHRKASPNGRGEGAGEFDGDIEFVRGTREWCTTRHVRHWFSAKRRQTKKVVAKAVTRLELSITPQHSTADDKSRVAKRRRRARHVPKVWGGISSSL